MGIAPIKQNHRDMLYLVACALHGQAPELKYIREMNLEEVYRAAKGHSLEAITAMALESAKAYGTVPPALAAKWKEDKEKAIRKNMLLDAERGQILRHMEEEGIWYMPLKGSILKDLYPKYGMRQMADNDILFDKTYQKSMLRYMRSRGYKAAGVGKVNHDAYEKPPVYNFELHTSLFGEMHNPVWVKYYQNIKDRLVKDEENGFGYHFRDEDFYVYVTTHTCKHYEGGGTGLRSLADTYVYVQKKGKTLDWKYIEGELNTLGIASLEREMRLLAEKLFSDPVQFYEVCLTEGEQRMLSYFCGSGTYGTMEIRVEKKLRKLLPEGEKLTVKEKLRYLWRRLIPDQEWFRCYEPFFARHKWLIPFFLVYRVFRGIFFRRKNMKNELYIVKKAGKKQPEK